MTVLNDVYFQERAGAPRLPIAEALIEGMVRAEARVDRDLGVAALRHYYACLAAQPRQLFLTTLLDACPYDTIVYLLTLWLKEDVLKALAAPPDVGTGAEAEETRALRRFFLGAELHAILGVLTRLPTTENTLQRHVLDMPDKLMVTLNLILLLTRHGHVDIERRVAEDPTGVRVHEGMEMGSVTVPCGPFHFT